MLLFSLFDSPIQFLIIVVAILTGFTVHEFAHALDLEKKFNIKLEHHLANEMRLFFNKKYVKGLDNIIHV